MPELQESQDYSILLPESLDILKNNLHAKVYTDKQLHRAASFMTAGTLALGAHVGAASEKPEDLFVVANLFARTVMADFINKGCISISAIDRFMDEAEKIYYEEMAKQEANEESNE